LGGVGASGGSSGSAGASGLGNGGSGDGVGGTAAGGSAGSGAAGDGGTAGFGGVAGGSGGEGGLSGKGGKGAGGRGEDECDAIQRELASTLAEARACNLALSRLTCTGEVVDECGCPVVVDEDDSEATRRYRMLMEQFNERCSVPCPAVVCRQPVSGRCRSEDNSVHGLCEPLLGGDR
jgi:hypothetical protein